MVFRGVAVKWSLGADLQAVQKEFHAVEVEEHLAVVRGLISDVPEGTPGELHHLVALQRTGTSHEAKASPAGSGSLWG